MPECFGDYYKKLLCTHGWATKPHGDGRRTGHIGRSTGCGVNLSATVSRCPTTNSWRVCVTKHNRTHNYDSKGSLRELPFDKACYGSERPRLRERAGQGRCQAKEDSENLQETTGKRVILRDVHNLVQQLKAKRRGQATVEERLEAVLRKFCSYRGNNATVFVDETKTTQTFTLQSRKMKRFFEAFPEVIMLDSTHGTNSSKYKLFSFMIDDTFGHGQYIQHSLVENESHACMKDVIEAFIGKKKKIRPGIVFECS